jgi:endogenous inhibitor of DNA gyrase (YacG/DUF329 family)
MIRGRCPICSRSYQIDALGELPSFPFCSERCHLIDLARWIDEKYAVPVSERAEEESESEAGACDIEEA